MVRLIVLDRDGVINQDSAAFVKSPQEWQALPGALAAIAALSAAGYRVVIFTNQSGIARGLFGPRELEAIHAKLIRAVEEAGGRIDGIYSCPHGPGDGCDCRKPAPGLLLRIAHDFDTSLAGVPVVGDSLRDLQAALAVGARAILVRSGNGEATLAAGLPASVEVFDDLAAVAAALLTEDVSHGRHG